jgi:hypothetical protein
MPFIFSSASFLKRVVAVWVPPSTTLTSVTLLVASSPSIITFLQVMFDSGPCDRTYFANARECDGFPGRDERTFRHCETGRGARERRDGECEDGRGRQEHADSSPCS